MGFGVPPLLFYHFNGTPKALILVANHQFLAKVLTLQVEIESSIRSNELEQRSLEFELENVEDVAALQRLSVTFNSDKNTYPLQILNYRTGNYRIRSNIVSLPTMLVRINGVSAEALVTLWNDVQLTALESNVLEALRLIEPRLERLSFRLDEGRNMSPFPIAKFKHLLEPIPLRNMGDGMQRLFGIALALVNAKEGILLIDEVENGLHYSVQPKVWKLVFKMAKQLNVQVFATTHSLDTIQSFQKAADEDKEEGMLIRLREKQGVLKAVTFDEGDLEVITESFLEVR